MSSGHCAISHGGTGFAAASIRRSTASPPVAARVTTYSRCFRCSPWRGWSPSQTSPSAVKPTMPPPPRSRSAVTSDPCHASGTRARSRNQVVSHAPPHGSPTANGVYSRSRASVTVIGSPCTWCASTSNGTRSGWTAGSTTSCSTRSTSRRNPSRFTITDRSYSAAWRPPAERRRSGGDDGQRLPAPHGRRARLHRVLPVDLPVREPREHLVERDAALEAGQRGPQAEVDAEPEREVLRHGPVDVERVGIGVPALVAVRGRVEQQHHAPGGHGGAVVLGVAGDVAALDRRRRL